MKTCPCKVYPLKPHVYIEKLGFARVYLFFLIFAPKHRLWVLGEAVLTSTHNLCFEQKYEKYQMFSNEIFNVYNFKNLWILHGHVFVMQTGSVRQSLPVCQCRSFEVYLSFPGAIK